MHAYAGLGAWAYTLAKRVTNVVLAIVAGAIFLPLTLLCAVLIKLTSSGPVFYTQFRSGKDGRVFRMFKLRTMTDNAEADTGPIWADDDDPRVIPWCRWMRRSHIDELPQILNVIIGQMSLVGPRPERPDILQDLAVTYPNTYRRLAVLPGITGLAQIRWKYDNLRESFGHKLRIDLEYVQKRSWFYDLYIIVATLPRFLSLSTLKDFQPVVRPATTGGPERRGKLQGFARQRIPKSTQPQRCE